MKEKIQDIIEKYPKHYSRFIKKDTELFAFVNQFQGETLKEKIYNAIHGNQTLVCPNGNSYKFRDIFYGYTYCSRSKNCQCQQEKQSKKLKGKPRSKEITEKIQQTNLKKYGSISPFGNKQVQEKAKQVVKEKYGVDNVFSLKSFQLQREQIMMKKFGVKCTKQAQISKETQDVIFDKTKFAEFMRNRTIYRAAKELNISDQTVSKYVKKYSVDFLRSKSYLEQEMKKFLESYTDHFVQNDRIQIKPYELDFYLADYKLAIEMNGDYWHSDARLSNNYHQKKWSQCKEKDIQLFQITESSWNTKQEILKSMIKNKMNETSEKIGARLCSIKELTSSKNFFDLNHIQGFKAAKLTYGLYYQNELVMAMSFGHPRFNKDYEWEIIRIGTKLDFGVSGGVSKLFNHFLKEKDPKSIISYSANDYGMGNVYNSLGFSFSHLSSPNYIWTDGLNQFSRYQTQKHKLGKILGESFNQKLSEKENMEQNGFMRIFDSGNSVWVLKR